MLCILGTKPIFSPFPTSDFSASDLSGIRRRTVTSLMCLAHARTWSHFQVPPRSTEIHTVCTGYGPCAGPWQLSATCLRRIADICCQSRRFSSPTAAARILRNTMSHVSPKDCRYLLSVATVQQSYRSCKDSEKHDELFRCPCAYLCGCQQQCQVQFKICETRDYSKVMISGKHDGNSPPRHSN